MGTEQSLNEDFVRGLGCMLTVINMNKDISVT